MPKTKKKKNAHTLTHRHTDKCMVGTVCRPACTNYFLGWPFLIVNTKYHILSFNHLMLYTFFILFFYTNNIIVIIKSGFASRSRKFLLNFPPKGSETQPNSTVTFDWYLRLRHINIHHLLFLYLCFVLLGLVCFSLFEIWTQRSDIVLQLFHTCTRSFMPWALFLYVSLVQSSSLVSNRGPYPNLRSGGGGTHVFPFLFYGFICNIVMAWK